MIFLGIVLATAAVAVALGVVTANSSAASLDIFGRHVPGVDTQAQVFLAGVVVTLLFAAGMTIATLGVGRSIRVRRELRELREEHQESLTTLELEKRRLERELARARNTPTATDPAARPAGGVPAAGRTPAPGDVPVAPRRARDRDPVSTFFDQTS